MTLQTSRFARATAILVGALIWWISPAAEAHSDARGSRYARSTAGSTSAPSSAPSMGSQAVLLELFTSEGCSSCPPADALLAQLNGTQTASGQLLIGLSEHVTYWNQLGWRDPYSADMFTARQNAYSNRFNLEGVYTPQLVINGREQIVGSDRSSLLSALDSERKRPRPDQGVLRIDSAEHTPGGLAIAYSFSEASGSRNADLFAALADDRDRSSVQRGENEGRTLAHVAVVRALIHVGPLHTAHGEQIVLHLPAGAMSSAAPQHVVLFAQQPNFGEVISVAERELAP